VTHGNFKIDSEVQIQAKPSMMTPEGGGGATGEETHLSKLPPEFQQQVRDLFGTYEAIAPAVHDANLDRTRGAFREFDAALAAVDGEPLTGPPRAVWREFAMLLGNDAVEGREAKRSEDADSAYLLLKGHMRRLRDQMAVTLDKQPMIERVTVTPAFLATLAGVWEQYLAVQRALAGDRFADARRAALGLQEATDRVRAASLSGRALQVWNREQANLKKVVAATAQAQDIETMRTAFAPLSQEIGVLARTFGFGKDRAVFELHCPMAFNGRGAIWYQDDKGVRNPYYGAPMLKCADRVEKLVHDEPAGNATSHR
jgi:Cu(I)/Ag(I) efflux system membrane fusion protein